MLCRDSLPKKVIEGRMEGNTTDNAAIDWLKTRNIASRQHLRSAASHQLVVPSY